jgi:hypothetical protein
MAYTGIKGKMDKNDWDTASGTFGIKFSSYITLKIMLVLFCPISNILS